LIDHWKRGRVRAPRGHRTIAVAAGEALIELAEGQLVDAEEAYRRDVWDANQRRVWDAWSAVRRARYRLQPEVACRASTANEQSALDLAAAVVNASSGLPGAGAVGNPSGRGLIVLAVTSAAGSEFAVAGPFEACVSVGGEEVRGCLADLPPGLLRGCAPVRRAGVYQRQRHMPELWFSTTVGRFMEYESLLERDWMLLLDSTATSSGCVSSRCG
jgi:hypothetical protein